MTAWLAVWLTGYALTIQGLCMTDYRRSVLLCGILAVTAAAWPLILLGKIIVNVADWCARNVTK